MFLPSHFFVFCRLNCEGKSSVHKFVERTVVISGILCYISNKWNEMTLFDQNERYERKKQ